MRVTEPSSDEDEIGQLHAPIRTQRQKDGLEGTTFPSPAAEAIGPAILLNTLGKGRVLTFAVSPGMAAGGEYRTTEVRALLANAIRALLPKSDLSIEAPAYVETVVTRDGDGKYRVHFNGFLTPPGSTDVKRPWAIPELMVDTPLYRAEVKANSPIKSVHGVNPSTEATIQGDRVSLLVNDLEFERHGEPAALAPVDRGHHPLHRVGQQLAPLRCHFVLC